MGIDWNGRRRVKPAPRSAAEAEFRRAMQREAAAYDDEPAVRPPAPPRAFEPLAGEQGRPGGIGIATLLLACLATMLASVASVLLLDVFSPHEAAPPAAAIYRDAAHDSGFQSVPTPAPIAGDPANSTGAIGGSGVEQSLQPLRTALQDPQATIGRINALIAFNGVLANYAKGKGVYPNSGGQMVAARKALAVLGDPAFEANVSAAIIDTMQYSSDGKSYKVVVIGSGDCAVARALRPAMVDPRRSSGPLDCIAYGLWSPKGKDF